MLGTVVFVSAWAFEGPLFWILFLIGLGVAVQAGWKMLEEYRDRFVITNQRVFRVNGVLNTARASVPLGRILDITVKKPMIGHWLNYGHFVFESAAQVQGLERHPLRRRHRHPGGHPPQDDAGRHHSGDHRAPGGG